MKYHISFFDTINLQDRYCAEICWNNAVLDYIPRAEAFNSHCAYPHTLSTGRFFIKSIKHHYKNRFTNIKINYVYE